MAHFPRDWSWTAVTRAMAKTTFTVAVVLGSHAAFATATTPAAEVISSASQVDQLTVLVTQAMPLGDIFDILKAQMPTWPFQDKPNAVTPEQLSCVRQELNNDNYLQQTKVDVQSYVDSHPDKVAADIQLMTSASPLWRAAMKAGISKKAYGTKSDPKNIVGDSTPEQVLALMDLIQKPNNEDLRKLIGIKGLQLDEQTSNGSQVGKNAALTKMTPLLLKSMVTCHVSMKSLL